MHRVTRPTVTFGTLEVAEALQSKTLFSHRGPVSGGAGHGLIWKNQCQCEMGGVKGRVKGRRGQMKHFKSKSGPDGGERRRVMKRGRETFLLVGAHATTSCLGARISCSPLTLAALVSAAVGAPGVGLTPGSALFSSCFFWLFWLRKGLRKTTRRGNIYCWSYKSQNILLLSSTNIKRVLLFAI